MAQFHFAMIAAGGFIYGPPFVPQRPEKVKFVGVDKVTQLRIDGMFHNFEIKKAQVSADFSDEWNDLHSQIHVY